MEKAIFETYLNQHLRLIPGLLKACGLYSCHPLYEDFSQEAALYLWQSFQSAPNLKEFEKVSYTYTKCRLLDLLKKEIRHHQHDCPLTDEILTKQTYETSDVTYLHQFFHSLTPLEVAICQSILKGYSLLETGKRLQMSRSTLYRHCKKLQIKGKKFLQQ